jgi:hypothetical protein
MMRACLVSGRAPSLENAGVDRVRDLVLLIFRTAEWGQFWSSISTWSWDPQRSRGAIRRTTSAPLGQNSQQGKTPKRASAASKCSQQRSDQAWKPVNSEQDCYSIGRNLMVAGRAGFQFTILRFESCRPSQPVPTSENGLPIRQESPPLAGFSGGPVSKLPNRRNQRPICRKVSGCHRECSRVGKLTAEAAFDHPLRGGAGRFNI